MNDPLTRVQIAKLLEDSQAKERLLFALGICSGMSLKDARALNVDNLYFPLVLNKRTILISEALRQMLELYKTSDRDADFFIFHATEEYMLKLVLKRTYEILGASKSYKALRITFIKTCAENDVPIDIVMANTGEPIEKVWEHYSKFRRVVDHSNFSIGFNPLVPA